MLQVGDLGAVLRLDDDKFNQGLNKAEGRFSSFGSGMASKAGAMGSAIGSALAVGASAAAVALVGVGTVGVKTFMDIESAAADAASKMDLGAIAQANGQTMEEAFKGVKEHVMALSDELGQLNTNAFDPTQIAQACANLAAGGFDVATASAKDLEPILSLATATTYDLDKSASLAMSTMNQFGMGVGDLGRISDVYATAAGKSAAGMSDFDYAMQQAGPVAKGVGMSFEELTARISKLADAGYSGEKSGTALRTAMMALTSPTKTQGETLAKLGISYDQIDPRVHSFGETLDLLTSKGADIYDFGEIFGKEGAAIVYSSAQQSAGVKELTAQLENSKGAASSMAKMMLDSLKGSMDAAMGAASSLAYLIGGKLAPSLKSAFDWFSSTGAPAVRTFIEAVADGDWTKIGSMLTDAVKAGWAKLKDLGGQLLGWLKGVNWGGLGEFVTKGIYAAWGELKSLGSDLLSSLKAVDWGSIGTSILSSISSAIDSVIDYAGGIYDYFIAIDWGGVWDSLVSAWNTAIAKLSDAGSTILGYFDSIDWGTVGFKIGTAIRDAIAALADIGQKVWDYLTSADWSGAGSSITEKIKGGLAKLKEFWTEFKTGLSVVDFAGAGKELGDKIKAGLGQITDYAKGIYDKIKKGWDDWIAADGPKKLGEDFAHSIVKGVVDLGKWIYAKIEGYWTSIKNDGGTLGTTIWQTFKNIFSTLIDFGAMALKAAWDFAKGFASTVLTAGKGTIGAAILDVVGDAMNSAWDGAGTALKEEAKQWRKDAEEIFTASPLDVAIETTFGGDGNPMDLDGSTIEVGVNYVSSGANLTPLKGPTGKPVITYQNNELQTQLASGKWTNAADWARKLGGAGQTDTAAFVAEIKTWKASGFNLSASEIEKLTSAFVSGREEYEKAKAEREAPAKEEAAIGIEGAKEEAKIETDAADDAADTTTTAATDAAKTEKEAALTFRQQIEKAVKDTDKTWRASNQALRFGIDETGRKWAVIGTVAQQQWEAAGKRWADDVAASSTRLQAGIGSAAADWSNKALLASSNFKGAVDVATGKLKIDISGAGVDLATKIRQSATDWTTKYSIASTTEQAKLITTGAGVRGSLTAGGNSIFNSAVSGGNALLSGANSGATALRSAASTIGSALSSFVGGKFPWQYFATGTKTSGPQMAVIGEDGPANPEYVIPTKTKRWDLLRAAMRDYGIPGFAAGTSTGGATAGGEGDAPPMSATFGIVGLAEMAKGVKKIITDLKDFFRISWGIVKSEASTYWKQINTVLTTEITLVRDMGWQAALDIRNSWLEMSKAITDDAKASWAGYWAAIEPSITSLKGSLIGAFQEAGAGMKDAIDSMVLNSESSLQAFEASWSEIWAQLVTDMTDAQTKISEGVAQIAAELQKISVNVNINVGGGGGGGSGGGFPGDWGFGGADDWLAPTGDWANTWSDYGNVCGQNYNQAVRDSIMPLDDRYRGGGGGAMNNFPRYDPFSYFASGALVEKPTEAIIGEAGPEMVLPAKLTRMFVSLAEIGFGQAGNERSDRIVIEDHSKIDLYLDGKKVTDQLMTGVMKKLQLRGAVPAK
ncbi:phage tail tape measure protein [Candidatus Pacearchaeota archaeon]|jgi:TP901 family phage tail tape measure protein|nr:phage tail tape measure protein [Candidatus Pacearchaeota archaeon]